MIVSGPGRASVMFTFWGRRGAMSRLVGDIGRAALADPRLATTLSVSRQNESFESFRDMDGALLAIDTFMDDVGALASAWRIPFLRRQLHDRIARERIDAVIELMPHVWSPFVMPVVKAAGARYATIVHDAAIHPGDHRSWAMEWVSGRVMRMADRVFALSDAVAERIAASADVPRSRLATLFLPDIDYGVRKERHAPRPGEPLRLAFLGRIMHYKGLPLFVDTIERLRADGVAIEAGVFGEGPLGDAGPRLANLGVEVVNRWLTEGEIGDVLARHHVVVLSHVEASQSGVAAAAFGAGMPVIATPVGALVEQVRHEVDGLLSAHVDASSLAAAIKRLAGDPALYEAMSRHIAASREARSLARFVTACVEQALAPATAGRGA